jgi:hypothetical protein
VLFRITAAGKIDAVAKDLAYRWNEGRHGGQYLGDGSWRHYSKTLYVTARTGLYRIKTNIAGIRPGPK